MRLVPDWPDPYGRPIYGRKQKNSQRSHDPWEFWNTATMFTCGKQRILYNFIIAGLSTDCKRGLRCQMLFIFSIVEVKFQSLQDNMWMSPMHKSVFVRAISFECAPIQLLFFIAELVETDLSKTNRTGCLCNDTYIFCCVGFLPPPIAEEIENRTQCCGAVTSRF